MSNPEERLVEINHLKKYFHVNKGLLHAVDDVSFYINKGETLGLVGESGCGKSTLGRVILHLHQRTGGRIIFQGKDISDVTKAQLKELRKDMQIIFQDPFSFADPRMTVGETLLEALESLRPDMSREKSQSGSGDSSAGWGLREDALRRYPHEFSGGQRQRIAIARAMLEKRPCGDSGRGHRLH